MTNQSEFSEILNNSQKISDNAHIYRFAEAAYEENDNSALGYAIRMLIEHEKKFRTDLHS